MYLGVLLVMNVHVALRPLRQSECAICGVRRKHCASADSTFRPLPQPECIEVLLQEVGNFEGSLSNDSMVCAACYIFCQRTLSQHDDLRLSFMTLNFLVWETKPVHSTMMLAT